MCEVEKASQAPQVPQPCATYFSNFLLCDIVIYMTFDKQKIKRKLY
jgi:hypothetical protein